MPLFQRDRSSTVVASEATADDLAAFTNLYGEFFDPIYWYCRSRLGEAMAAEDAASTVFTRALAARPRYDDPALRSWLFAIAHNVIANAFRAPRLQAPLESAEEIPDPAALPEDRLVANERRDLLLDALWRLPNDHRQVVELRMAGLTGPEIASVLNRSHGAVKMLQLRAFASLRVILADATGDGGGRHE